MHRKVVVMLLYVGIVSVYIKKGDGKNKEQPAGCKVTGTNPIVIEKEKNGDTECAIPFKKNHYMNVEAKKLLGIDNVKFGGFTLLSGSSYSMYNETETYCDLLGVHVYLNSTEAKFQFEQTVKKEKDVSFRIEVTFQQCLEERSTTTFLPALPTTTESSKISKTTTILSTSNSRNVVTTNPTTSSKNSSAVNAGQNGRGEIKVEIISPVTILATVVAVSIAAYIVYVRRRRNKPKPFDNDTEVDVITSADIALPSAPAGQDEDNIYQTINENSTTVINELYNMNEKDDSLHEEKATVLYGAKQSEEHIEAPVENGISSTARENQVITNVLYSSTPDNNTDNNHAASGVNSEVDLKENVLYGKS